MKKLLLFAALILGQTSYATHWMEFFVYHQKNYMQGPWKGSDFLDEKGAYLMPTLYSELMGSEEVSVPLAIMEKLAEAKPDLYVWNFDVEINNDTIQLYPDAPLLSPIENNEILASMLQVNFCNYVTITLEGQSKTFSMENIALPFFTLAGYEEIPLEAEDKPETAQESKKLITKENVISILIGAFIGFFLLFGYRYWKK